jgi:hypothetical protein
VEIMASTTIYEKKHFTNESFDSKLIWSSNRDCTPFPEEINSEKVVVDKSYTAKVYPSVGRIICRKKEGSKRHFRYKELKPSRLISQRLGMIRTVTLTKTKKV